MHTTRAPRDVDSDSEDRDPETVPASRNDRHAVNTRSRDVESDRGGAAAPVAAAARGLARLIRLAAGIIAAIIALGILFVVLEANPDNTIVSAVDDAARALVGPFDDMFSIDNAKTAIAVNWGIAAFVYLILGALIAWLIERIGGAGLRLRRA
jgi:hypothetical protein